MWIPRNVRWLYVFGGVMDRELTKDEQIVKLKGELSDLKSGTTWESIDNFYGNTRDCLLLYRDGSGIEVARYGEHEEFPNLPGWFSCDYSDETVMSNKMYSHWMLLPEFPKKEITNG